MTALMPPLIYIDRENSSCWRVKSLVKPCETELVEGGSGSEFIRNRLVEVLLVELLRQEVLRLGPEATGLLAGLGDALVAEPSL